jgi:hypothetical protein
VYNRLVASHAAVCADGRGRRRQDAEAAAAAVLARARQLDVEGVALVDAGSLPARRGGPPRRPADPAARAAEGPVDALRSVRVAEAQPRPGSPQPRADDLADPAVARLVQQRLADAGFDPGSHDGVFGPRSQAALRAFQRARGIEVSADDAAALNEATLKALQVSTDARQ